MRNGHIAGILITISTNMILIECLSMYGFSFQNHMAKTSRHLVFPKYGPQKFKDHIRRFTSCQSFRRSRITMMPEGPEVKTLVDQLQGGVGMLFRGIEFCSGRYVRHGPPKGYEAFLSTLDKDSDIIEEWNCKGKFIYLILNQGEIRSKSTRSPEDFQRSIWITLGMSGRFVSNKLLTSEKSETRWILHLADRFEPANTHTILYHDPRNFGTLNFCLSAADLRTKLNSLGPDILNTASTNEELFLQIIAKQRSKNDMNICQFLMNQKVSVLK
jgi:formamidopyrimidine-DNA glycosylase